MSETRRTQGGLIINSYDTLTLLTFDPDDHGLQLPELTDLGDDAIEACKSGDLFFRNKGKAVLALALSPRSASDRLHIFPEQDMWRTYLEYWLPTGGNVPIVISYNARLSLEMAGVTTSIRTGISEEEVIFTDEQHARMIERQAELAVKEELSELDLDQAIQNFFSNQGPGGERED
jgi:hypothetical protein